MLIFLECLSNVTTQNHVHRTLIQIPALTFQHPELLEASSVRVERVLCHPFLQSGLRICPDSWLGRETILFWCLFSSKSGVCSFTVKRSWAGLKCLLSLSQRRGEGFDPSHLFSGIMVSLHTSLHGDRWRAWPGRSLRRREPRHHWLSKADP